MYLPARQRRGGFSWGGGDGGGSGVGARGAARGARARIRESRARRPRIVSSAEGRCSSGRGIAPCGSAALDRADDDGGERVLELVRERRRDRRARIGGSEKTSSSTMAPHTILSALGHRALDDAGDARDDDDVDHDVGDGARGEREADDRGGRRGDRARATASLSRRRCKPRAAKEGRVRRGSSGVGSAPARGILACEGRGRDGRAHSPSSPRQGWEKKHGRAAHREETRGCGSSRTRRPRRVLLQVVRRLAPADRLLEPQTGAPPPSIDAGLGRRRARRAGDRAEVTSESRGASPGRPRRGEAAPPAVDQAAAWARSADSSSTW